jgi:hypothetical protein
MRKHMLKKIISEIIQPGNAELERKGMKRANV